MAMDVVHRSKVKKAFFMGCRTPLNRKYEKTKRP